MVRAIVSVAENPDDPMRIICMETLIEIGALDTSGVNLNLLMV
jgi:rapamycin-insensitive companion of mTOR